jgi:hypothetical protein
MACPRTASGGYGRPSHPHSRPGLKRRVLRAFNDGIAPKPETTFGNVKADVLERYVAGYQRGNFVDIILNSDWPE